MGRAEALDAVVLLGDHAGPLLHALTSRSSRRDRLGVSGQPVADGAELEADAGPVTLVDIDGCESHGTRRSTG